MTFDEVEKDAIGRLALARCLWKHKWKLDTWEERLLVTKKWYTCEVCGASKVVEIRR